MTDSSEIGRRRLRAQLVTNRARSPAEAVAALLAVQAQDYRASLWAVGLRVEDAAEATIEDALARGTILRAHALRGTWQLVAPADLRWLLALVGPQVNARSARRERQLGIDAPLLRKSRSVLERVLRDGAHRTRSELARALGATGPALSHVLAHLELDAVICSGATRGKHTTWALVDERVPPAPPLARDEAIAGLARRYFESRGPATIDDFIWWTGLNASEAQAGLEAVRSRLAARSENGRELFFRAGETVRADREPYLLPAFDEYLIAYRDRDAVLALEHARSVNDGGGLLAPCVVMNGRVVGTWRRTNGAKQVSIDVELFERSTVGLVRDALGSIVERYGAFLGVPARLAGVKHRPRSA